MHHFSSLNWLGVLVAALSGFVIGGLWYGPLFQKPWMQLTGMTKEKGAQVSMAVTFGGAYVLNLVGAAGIAILLGAHRSWQGGLHTGLFTGVFFIATALGVIYLFEQRPLKLWFINAGYQIVNFTAMGTILGVWPQ
ncbi:MAG: DUF1761 domain-containing protein [Steroidobacteraceae bacterium]